MAKSDPLNNVLNSCSEAAEASHQPGAATHMPGLLHDLNRRIEIISSRPAHAQ